MDGEEEEGEEEEDFEDSPMELDQMSDEPAPRRKRHRGAGTGGFQAARVLDEGYSLIGNLQSCYLLLPPCFERVSCFEIGMEN